MRTLSLIFQFHLMSSFIWPRCSQLLYCYVYVVCKLFWKFIILPVYGFVTSNSFVFRLFRQFNRFFSCVKSNCQGKSDRFVAMRLSFVWVNKLILNCTIIQICDYLIFNCLHTQVLAIIITKAITHNMGLTSSHLWIHRIEIVSEAALHLDASLLITSANRLRIDIFGQTRAKYHRDNVPNDGRSCLRSWSPSTSLLFVMDNSSMKLWFLVHRNAIRKSYLFLSIECTWRIQLQLLMRLNQCDGIENVTGQCATIDNHFWTNNLEG